MKITFRGRAINGEWVYGNLTRLKAPYEGVKTGTYISNRCGFPFAHEVIPSSVEMSIGLTDVKGEDIFTKVQ